MPPARGRPVRTGFALDLDGHSVAVDSAYLASMVFVGGGPYLDLLLADPGQARRDPRLFSSGALLGFRLPGSWRGRADRPRVAVACFGWVSGPWRSVRFRRSWPPPAVSPTPVPTRSSANGNCAFAFALAVAFDARDLLPLAASYPGFSRLLDAWL